MQKRKLTSWFLTLCLLVTQILTPDVASAASLAFSPVQNEAELFTNHWQPSALAGKVTQRVRVDQPQGTLIHIQDAHAVFEAQKNIEALIAEVHRVKPVEALFIEGGAGELDPQLRHFFPEGITLTREERDSWMKEGHLTGAESYLMENGKTRGYGIEEVKSYWDDVELYRRVDAGKSNSKAFSESVYVAWKKEAGKKFKPALKRYLEVYAQSQLNAAISADWFDALRDYLKSEWNRDLSAIEEQIEFPMLTRYIYLKKIDGTPDFSKIEKQKQDFFASLKSLDRRPKASGLVEAETPRGLTQASPEVAQRGASVEPILHEIDSLIEKSKANPIDFSDAREIFEQLAAYLPNDFSMEKWPDLKKLIERIILAGEVDAEKLMREAKQLHIQIIEKDAQAEKQRALALLLEKQILLTKLLTLELTREDFQKILDQPAQPQELTAQLERMSNNTPEVAGRIFGSGHSGFKVVNQTYNDAILFYQGAIERETAMKRVISGRAKKGDVSVVVTGGFHAKGMEAFAREQNWNYVSVMPRISKINPEDFAHYRRALLGTEISEVAEGHPRRLRRVEGAVPVARSQVAAALITSHEIQRRSVSPLLVAPLVRSEIRIEQELENVVLFKPQLIAALSAVNNKKRQIGPGRLLGKFRENTGTAARDVLGAEQVAELVVNEYNLGKHPPLNRALFALGVFDEAAPLNRIHTRLTDIYDLIKLEGDVKTRFDISGETYEKIRKILSKAERELTMDENVLLRFAVNKIILMMPREERLALEKEYLAEKLVKEIEQPGSGNLPQIVFLTDYHGGRRVGSLIAYALGVENYQNILSVEELERRLEAEKIDIDKMDILFVGGSDYVDRGVRPNMGAQFNQWLRSKGKLKFIPGNHEFWKNWNLLGVHLLVNDEVEAIAKTKARSSKRVVTEKDIDRIFRFIEILGEGEEKEKRVKALRIEIKSKLEQFLKKYLDAHGAKAKEKIIGEFSDEIINAGDNPNHSIHWWAREWYQHAQWADVFFDEINLATLNKSLRAINDQIEKMSEAQRMELQEKLNDNPYLKLNEHKTGIQFFPADYFEVHPELKSARDFIKGLKADNAAARVSGAPQKDVPTLFPQTSAMAKNVAEAINQFIGKESIPAQATVKTDELITPDNYQKNPMVVETLNWDFQNMRLFYLDVYGNLYVHGIIPTRVEQVEGVDKIVFDVRYKGLEGLQAIQSMEYDMRRFFDNQKLDKTNREFRKKMFTALGEAMLEINRWYSDRSGPNMKGALKGDGVERFLKMNGLSELALNNIRSLWSARAFSLFSGFKFVGHVNQEALRKYKLAYLELVEDGLTGVVDTDFEISEGGYLGMGGGVSLFARNSKTNTTESGFKKFGFPKTIDSLKKEIAALKKKRDEKGILDADRASISEKIKTLEEELKNLSIETESIEDLTMEDPFLSDRAKRHLEAIQTSQGYAAHLLNGIQQELVSLYQSLARGAEERLEMEAHQHYVGRAQYWEARVAARSEIRQFFLEYEDSWVKEWVEDDRYEDDTPAKLTGLKPTLRRNMYAHYQNGAKALDAAQKIFRDLAGRGADVESIATALRPVLINARSSFESYRPQNDSGALRFLSFLSRLKLDDEKSTALQEFASFLLPKRAKYLQKLSTEMTFQDAARFLLNPWDMTSSNARALMAKVSRFHKTTAISAWSVFSVAAFFFLTSISAPIPLTYYLGLFFIGAGVIILKVLMRQYAQGAVKPFLTTGPFSLTQNPIYFLYFIGLSLLFLTAPTFISVLALGSAGVGIFADIVFERAKLWYSRAVVFADRGGEHYGSGFKQRFKDYLQTTPIFIPFTKPVEKFSRKIFEQAFLSPKKPSFRSETRLINPIVPAEIQKGIDELDQALNADAFDWNDRTNPLTEKAEDPRDPQSQVYGHITLRRKIDETILSHFRTPPSTIPLYRQFQNTDSTAGFISLLGVPPEVNGLPDFSQPPKAWLIIYEMNESVFMRSRDVSGELHEEEIKISQLGGSKALGLEKPLIYFEDSLLSASAALESNKAKSARSVAAFFLQHSAARRHYRKSPRGITMRDNGTSFSFDTLRFVIPQKFGPRGEAEQITVVFDRSATARWAVVLPKNDLEIIQKDPDKIAEVLAENRWVLLYNDPRVSDDTLTLFGPDGAVNHHRALPSQGARKKVSLMGAPIFQDFTGKLKLSWRAVDTYKRFVVAIRDKTTAYIPTEEKGALIVVRESGRTDLETGQTIEILILDANAPALNKNFNKTILADALLTSDRTGTQLDSKILAQLRKASLMRFVTRPNAPNETQVFAGDHQRPFAVLRSHGTAAVQFNFSVIAHVFEKLLKQPDFIRVIPDADFSIIKGAFSEPVVNRLGPSSEYDFIMWSDPQKPVWIIPQTERVQFNKEFPNQAEYRIVNAFDVIQTRSEMREEELKAKLQMLSAAISDGVKVDGKKGTFDFLPDLKNLMDPWLDFYLNANEQDKAILNGIFDNALQTHKKLVGEHRRVLKMSGGAPAAKSFFQVEISGLEDLFKKQRNKEKYKNDDDETKYLFLIAGNLSLMLSHQKALLPYNPFLVEGDLSQEQKNPILLIQAVKAAHRKILEGWATFPRKLKGGYFFVPRGDKVSPTDKWFSPAVTYSLLSLGFKPVLTKKKLAHEFAKRRILQATAIPAAEENQRVPLLKIIYDQMSDARQPDAAMAYLLKKPLPSGETLNYESFLESIETDPEVLESYVIDMSKSLDEMDAAHRKLMQAAQEGRLLSFGEMFLGNEAVEHYVRSLLGDLADKDEWQQAIQKNIAPESEPTLNAGLPTEDEMDAAIQGSLNNFKTRETLNRLFVGAKYLEPESSLKWRDDNGRLNKLLDKLEGHPKLVDAFMILIAAVLRLDAPGKWNLKFELAEAAVDRLIEAEASLETILSELIQDKQASGKVSSQRNLQANLFALFQLRLFGEKHLPSLKSWLEAITLALKEEHETEENVRNQLRQAMNLSVPVTEKNMTERKQVWTALFEANVLPADFFKEKFGLMNQLMQANLDWVLVYEDVLLGMVLNWAQTDAKKMIEEWQRLGAIQSDQDYEAEIKKRKKKEGGRAKDIRDKDKIKAIVAREKADLEKKLDAVSGWFESNESALSLGLILQEKAVLFENGNWPPDWKRFFPTPKESEQAPVVASNNVAHGFWDWPAIKQAAAITGEIPEAAEPAVVLPAKAVPSEKIDPSWNETNGFGSKQKGIFQEFADYVAKHSLKADGLLESEPKKRRQIQENLSSGNISGLAADVLLLLIDIRKFELAPSLNLKVIEQEKKGLNQSIVALDVEAQSAVTYLISKLNAAFEIKAAPLRVAEAAAAEALRLEREQVAAQAHTQIKQAMASFEQKSIAEFLDQPAIHAEETKIFEMIDGLSALTDEEKAEYRRQTKNIYKAKADALKILHALEKGEKELHMIAPNGFENLLQSLEVRLGNFEKETSKENSDFVLLKERFTNFKTQVQKRKEEAEKLKEAEVLKEKTGVIQAALTVFNIDSIRGESDLLKWQQAMGGVMNNLPKTPDGNAAREHFERQVNYLVAAARDHLNTIKQQAEQQASAMGKVTEKNLVAPPVVQPKTLPVKQPIASKLVISDPNQSFKILINKVAPLFAKIEESIVSEKKINEELYSQLEAEMAALDSISVESLRAKDRGDRMRVEAIWRWLGVLQAWSENNTDDFVIRYKEVVNLLGGTEFNKFQSSVLEMKAWAGGAANASEKARRDLGKQNLHFIPFREAIVTRSESRVNQPSAIQVKAARLLAAGYLSPKAVVYYLGQHEKFLEILPKLISVERNKQESEKLQSILGIDITVMDGVILSSGLVEQGFLAAAGKIFKDVPFAFIAEGEQKSEALKLIEKEGWSERIFIADNIQHAQELLKKYGVTRIQGMATWDLDDALPDVADIIRFAKGQLQKFYEEAGILGEVQHWAQIFSTFATAA